jgi:hypothetical protein
VAAAWVDQIPTWACKLKRTHILHFLFFFFSHFYRIPLLLQTELYQTTGFICMTNRIQSFIKVCRDVAEDLDDDLAMDLDMR